VHILHYLNHIETRLFSCIIFYGHTHPFNGPFSRTTWVSRYQKGKTSLDFTGARDSEWQSSAGPYASAPRSRQITMPAPHCSVFTGRMPFLPPNQQHQSTEGTMAITKKIIFSPTVGDIICSYCSFSSTIYANIIHQGLRTVRIHIFKNNIAR